MTPIEFVVNSIQSTEDVSLYLEKWSPFIAYFQNWSPINGGRESIRKGGNPSSSSAVDASQAPLRTILLLEHILYSIKTKITLKIRFRFGSVR